LRVYQLQHKTGGITCIATIHMHTDSSKVLCIATELILPTKTTYAIFSLG